MADIEPDRDPSTSLRGLWRGRLGSRALFGVAIAAIFVGLVATGQLAPVPAGFALLLVLAAGVLVPGGENEAARRAADRRSETADPPSLHLFAEALPDPSIVLDRRSLVEYRNQAAAHQFPGLVVGKAISLSLRAPAVLNAIEAVRSGHQPVTVELHQTVPTETWHRVTVAPLVAGDGGGLLVVSMQSLTDEKRLDTLRTDFIANASHELRTPLTSLLGFIETLLGPAAKDAAAREKFLGIMRNQALRMSKLIEDLLSLSRIEMRQHMRPTASVDLVLLLAEVREGLAGAAREAGAAIELSLPAAPISVMGERDELYEVFENLIDNALKYGAQGGRVDVALDLVTTRPGYDVLVSVTDYGPGVEAAEVPRLTERFYRVDAESSRKKKGTGLGLAIVKHIVTRHRGLMSISSRPGQGMRVEVFLPR
jgi:two-component system phosphate regulon sensor histidine kinase PhoR